MEKVFNRVVRKFRTQQEFAAELGVTKQVVGHWKRRGIPAAWVGRISALTGIPPHQIRPDLFPRPRPRKDSAA